MQDLQKSVWAKDVAKISLSEDIYRQYDSDNVDKYSKINHHNGMKRKGWTGDNSL